MPDDSAPDAADKITLRLPPGMRARIRAAASASGRSMNGEIIACISAGLEGGGKVDVAQLAALVVDGLVDRLARSPTSKPTRRK